MAENTLHACWMRFLQILDEKLGATTVTRWVRSFDVSFQDSPKASERKVILQTKDSFQALWFEEHLKNYLPLAKDPLGNPLQIILRSPQQTKPKPVIKEKKSNAKAQGLSFLDLDPSLTFEKFISTEDNLIVFKLLQEMCSFWIAKHLKTLSPILVPNTTNTPFIPPNPIYICGPTGSGKTHLITACALRLQQIGFSTIVASAEIFTDHVVKSMRTGQMASFRQLWRKADIIFIEDIQTFSRKNATQEEFFHTFNTLHMAGKQIVLTANCLPQQLQYIEPRLISRFEWGIVLPLPPLPKKLYPQLLERKSQLQNFPLSTKLTTFLLGTFASSPKALTQALFTLISRLKSSRSVHTTVSQIQELLGDIIEKESSTSLTPQKIIAATAHAYGLTIEDILSKSQSREYSSPRKIAMYLMRKHLKLPYMKIADIFQKNHSTVISSIRHIESSISDTSTNVGSSIATIEIALYDTQR